MNFFLKQKAWFFIAIFFMVVTTTLLIGMWQNKHRHGDHNRNKGNLRGHINRNQHENFSLTNYLATELDFNAVQKSKLDGINTIAEAKKDSLWEENEISKTLFNKELYAYTPNKNKQDSLIKCMNNFTEQFNKSRIEHIDNIKSLCSETQKKKLPGVLINLNGINFKRKYHKHH